MLQTLQDVLTRVDLADANFWIACGSVAFNPLFWNIVARQEYKRKYITKALGSPLRGCYLLALTIFMLGLYRDYLFTVAIDNQPRHELLDQLPFKAVGALSFVLGNIFVLSSMYKLGVTGTYLGDYFGILMKERVTSFPFNVLDNPMYMGSTMAFLGTAIWRASPAGLWLSLVVYVVYRVALTYEG
ncbi:Phosphatidyl-N-methylethanolamine N-methyltransferase, partial [Quaeritorhiza haematococci]